MSVCNSILLTIWFWEVLERTVITRFVTTTTPRRHFRNMRISKNMISLGPKSGIGLQSSFVK